MSLTESEAGVMDEVDLVNEVSVVKAGEVVDEVGVDEAYD